MGQTFQGLLDYLVVVRDADYRSDREREQARLESLDYVAQKMLEMLRDKFDK